MYNFFYKIVRLFCLCVFLFGHSSADAQNRNLPSISTVIILNGISDNNNKLNFRISGS